MSQFRFLAAVAVGLFTTMTASLMLAPLLVAIATEFDTSVAVAGLISSPPPHLRRGPCPRCPWGPCPTPSAGGRWP